VSSSATDIVTKLASIVFVAESFVNALVYILKLPGFKQTIMPKVCQSAKVHGTTAVANKSNTKW
jgi:hypothetical protein